MVDITAFPIETIRVDALDPTLSPTVDHVIIAMKDGLTVQLTLGQILSLIGTYGVGADSIDFTPAAGIAATSVQAAIEELVADVVAAYAVKTRTIIGGGLATGGGDLTADRTITVTPADDSDAITGTNTTRAMNAATTKTSVLTFAAGAPHAIFEDQKASGTGGGDSTTTMTTRDLTAEVRDPRGIASLSSNQITVAVNAWCEFECTFFSSAKGKACLWDVTAGAMVAGSEGTNAQSDSGPSTNSKSCGGGPMIAGHVYEIRCQAGTIVTNGFGAATSLVGLLEKYTRVHIWEIY